MCESSVEPTLQYRVVLIDRVKKTVLLQVTEQGWQLPHVVLPLAVRPAEELCLAILKYWGLEALVVDFLSEETSVPITTVASCMPEELWNSELIACELNQIPKRILSVNDSIQVAEIIDGNSSHRLTRIDWLREAIDWVEKVAGRKLRQHRAIHQLNAGGAFVLLRFTMEDGRQCWLKATGEPNVHEPAVTLCLAALFPDAIPVVLGYRGDWNAWLAEDGGARLPEVPTAEQLAGVAQKFASLQLRSLPYLEKLRASGAWDLSLLKLRNEIDMVIDYLSGAMIRQRSTRVLPLSSDQLKELAERLAVACECMSSLGIPDTLVHNDLSHGNILDDHDGCKFTDWSEAAIGNPFLSYERICQLNATHRTTIESVYWTAWAPQLTPHVIGRALALSPLLAIYAFLLGRGDWMDQPSTPQFDSCARSLARHMYRAAQSPILLEALCR